MLKCRFCKSELKHIFADLGMSPLSNSYVGKKDINKKENFYPLKVYICKNCFLVQLPEHSSPEDIFTDYAYFSSYSDSWLKHAENYVKQMIDRFDFDKNSLIVELGSNDGYLLQYFKGKNIPVLGVEPAKNVAKVARKKGIPTLVEFFNLKTANKMKKKGQMADLLMGINFLAQIPDLNDFVSGMKVILTPDGIITVEFPHLLKLIDEKQFDTIYHEHFSYFSFFVIVNIFRKHGLTVFDVEELPTHGGSLRIFAKHAKNKKYKVSSNVKNLIKVEKKAGLNGLKAYQNFNEDIKQIKKDVLSFLIKENTKGKKIVGYGAPAKGNTLLNYCGIGTELIEYTVDRNPNKQNTLLPGSRIPVYDPKKINETKPDFVVIMPWNIKKEIMKQMSQIKGWGGKFVTFIPEVKIY